MSATPASDEIPEVDWAEQQREAIAPVVDPESVVGEIEVGDRYDADPVDVAEQAETIDLDDVEEPS